MWRAQRAQRARSRLVDQSISSDPSDPSDAIRSIEVAEGGCGCLPFYGHEAIGGTLGGTLTIPQLEWDALGSEVPDVSAFPFRMVFKNVRRLPAQREGHHQLHAEQVCKAVWMWIDDR